MRNKKKNKTFSDINEGSLIYKAEHFINYAPPTYIFQVQHVENMTLNEIVELNRADGPFSLSLMN